MNEIDLIKEFQHIEDNFNRAVVTNDIAEIKKCITSDWVLVDSQGGIIPQERFFEVLKQGLLSHSAIMVSWELFVEVLTTAFCEVAPEKLGTLVRSDKNGLNN